jgi:hypothetical protein
MCVGVSAVYFAVGAVCLHFFVRVARSTGSLKLT